MAAMSPSPSKQGRREDDDDESHHRKKLEKGKEPAANDVDKEPLFDDTEDHVWFEDRWMVAPLCDE
jgi:hypothetical protein